MRYLLIDNSKNVVANVIELDPENIFDGNEIPLPPVEFIPQPDIPQAAIEKTNKKGEVVFDENERPIMVEQKSLKQDPIEFQPPPIPDPRYRVPEGFTIEASELGNPGDSWPLPAAKPVNPADDIKSQIIVLEASITPRRLREAILATDGGWLADIDGQIVKLRKKL